MLKRGSLAVAGIALLAFILFITKYKEGSSIISEGRTLKPVAKPEKNVDIEPNSVRAEQLAEAEPVEVSVVEEPDLLFTTTSDLWAQIPSSNFDQLYYEVQELLQIEDADYLASELKELFESEDPYKRLLAYLVKIELGSLGDDDLIKLAEEEQPLGWNVYAYLSDFGFAEWGLELKTLLNEAALTENEAKTLFNDPGLLVGGQLHLFEYMRSSLDGEALEQQISTILQQGTFDYALEIKALLMMRDQLPFEEYQRWLSQLAQDYQLGLGKAKLQSGLEAIIQRNDGPLAYVAGPLIVNQEKVELMFNQPYKAMIDDLIAMLEHAMSSERNFIQEGTGSKIMQRIAETANDMVLATDDPRIRKLSQLSEKADAFAVALMRYEELELSETEKLIIEINEQQSTTE